MLLKFYRNQELIFIKYIVIPSLKVLNLRNIWTLIKRSGMKCIELKASFSLCVVNSGTCIDVD